MDIPLLFVCSLPPFLPYFLFAPLYTILVLKQKGEEEEGRRKNNSISANIVRYSNNDPKARKKQTLILRVSCLPALQCCYGITTTTTTTSLRCHMVVVPVLSIPFHPPRISKFQIQTPTPSKTSLILILPRRSKASKQRNKRKEARYKKKKKEKRKKAQPPADDTNTGQTKEWIELRILIIILVPALPPPLCLPRLCLPSLPTPLHSTISIKVHPF